MYNNKTIPPGHGLALLWFDNAFHNTSHILGFPRILPIFALEYCIDLILLISECDISLRLYKKMGTYHR